MNGVSNLPTSVNPAAVGGPAVAPRVPMERAQEGDSSAKGDKATGMDVKGLEKMVKEANQSLGAMTSLRITLDQESHKMVVRVVDQANGNKVIRQIPSEDVMDLAKRIDALRELKGFFFDAKA